HANTSRAPRSRWPSARTGVATRRGTGSSDMSQLEELLAVWLPRQRWFSGKGIPIRQIRVESRHTLVSARPEGPDLSVLVLQAGQRGRSSRYQLLLGSRPPRSLPPELASVAIGVCQISGGRPRVIYDAAHDAQLTGMLL